MIQTVLDGLFSPDRVSFHHLLRRASSSFCSRCFRSSAFMRELRRIERGGRTTESAAVRQGHTETRPRVDLRPKRWTGQRKRDSPNIKARGEPRALYVDRLCPAKPLAALHDTGAEAVAGGGLGPGGLVLLVHMAATGGG